METHPLKLDEHPRWVYYKPTLSMLTEVLLVNLHNRKETPGKAQVGGSYSCREELCNNLRNKFITLAVLVDVMNPASKPWEKAETLVGEIVLNDPKAQSVSMHVDAHTCELLTGPETKDYAIKGMTCEDLNKRVARMADIVVGIPCMLLGPPGNTARESIQANGNWTGTTNFFLQHPALTALITGLYRQAFSLVRTGVDEEAYKKVPYEKVKEVLLSGDQKAALILAEELRPWILVPEPTKYWNNTPFVHSNLSIPFPWYPRKRKEVSYWQRFIRLHRGIARHGLEAVLGENFNNSWVLLSNGKTFHNGVFSLWGTKGQLTPSHKRVMEMGKPK